MTQTDIAVISESLRSSTDDPVIYVAEGHSEELAGFIHLRSVTDCYRRKEHGHVADIVVARAYEGHGLAKQLLSKAEEWAIDQDFDWLSISIFNGNTRAKHLYETLGYRSDIARLVKPLC
jgi:ribosomal protein S18 acetylase RimI-like enzyme